MTEERIKWVRSLMHRVAAFDGGALQKNKDEAVLFVKDLVKAGLDADVGAWVMAEVANKTAAMDMAPDQDSRNDIGAYLSSMKSMVAAITKTLDELKRLKEMPLGEFLKAKPEGEAHLNDLFAQGHA